MDERFHDGSCCPMIEKPVFLVGSERSGTTLLCVMMSHHPKFTAFQGFVDSAEALIIARGSRTDDQVDAGLQAGIDAVMKISGIE